MQTENNHLVIMAGGVGSRFWPMSTPELPKQFVDVLGCGKTLIQMTMERFAEVVPADNVWVVTNACYAAIVREQLPQMPADHILLEPCRRNTAPCIAYVSWRIKALDPKANIVVSPSDHIVMDVAEFRRVVSSSLQFASETDAIVTLGMKATRPETGYGYIQTDLSTPCARNREMYRVDSFREKPDLVTAQKYVAQNNFFWNAGIFVWNVGTIVNALRIYQPQLSEIFEQLLPYYGTEREQELIDERFPQCENISIDYAVLEKADEIFCFPASFGWSDLGTWGSLYDNKPRDAQGNVLIGNVECHDSHNCVVHCTQEKRVIIQGLEGYIVAEHDDALLICRLSEEQQIRKFTEGK
ncbi:MAG: mannose-1-phosphate guanylyltransferase [Bacteroidaceae bacterium]|nr:mannose-1-phosphate guanylyltransferase [Bacteroidaceae bacterium]